jgi:heme/copper-type cytochrome/quinol oxidase subunit 2
MDFPVFHFDWLNDRFLIAVIAILHVLINHGLAVGFVPFVTWLEQKGVAQGGPDKITDENWDKLAYRLMWVAFIITTTIGAMTGVGIWFSAAVVSPASIGSLIRVFYWAWFTEWIVFVTEVVLILIYFLTWKNSNRSMEAKAKHVKLGWTLSIFSWVTMAIIVAILGFMMDPGNWNTHHNLFNGVLNPIYLPQLAFRTPTAMVLGGTFGMFLILLFTDKGSALRIKAVKVAARWILVWAPFSSLGAIVYYQVMPEAMKANLSTAVGSMDFEQYYNLLKYFIIGAISLTVLLSALALFKPAQVRVYMSLVVLVAALGFLGIFERVREFIRKPYVIGGYMYSNLMRPQDYPLYQRDGILKHATYTTVTEITEENKVEAGKNVFLLACSRCHTTQGVNSIVYVFERMYGLGIALEENSLKAYIPNMHVGRTYMPPFPGNEKELDALVAYIRNIQQTKDPLYGAQDEGVTVNPLNNGTAALKLLEKQQSDELTQNQLTTTENK